MPAKPLPGPSRLSQILKNLNREPKPLLTGLKAINLSCATKNEHFGARHFIKEELPRIQYANPELKINVKMIENPPIRWGELWRSEMQLEFKNGISKKLEMTSKHSISILEELMDAAGGDRWQTYKKERAAAGEAPEIPTRVHISHPRQAPGTNFKEGIASALP